MEGIVQNRTILPPPESTGARTVHKTSRGVLEPAPQGLVSAEVVKQSHHSLRLTKNANQPCAISDWRVLTLSGPCARPQ